MSDRLEPYLGLPVGHAAGTLRQDEACVRLRGVTREDDDANPWLLGAPVWHGDRWGQLAALAYAGSRDGTLSADTAFDLAMFLEDWARPQPVFGELAAATVQAVDQTRVADLAREALAAVGYVPDYRTEPQLLETINRALEVLEHDLRATGLTGHARPVLPDDLEVVTAWVQYQRYSGHTSGISPSEVLAGGPEFLALVADELQDAVMEALFGVWPVCPQHQLGAHPQVFDKQAVWWCSDRSGHVISAVGQWGR